MALRTNEKQDSTRAVKASQKNDDVGWNWIWGFRWSHVRAAAGSPA